MKKISILTLACLLLSCKGDEGPTGPEGLEGPQGPAGPGSRKVYSGTILNEWEVISVPELDESNMPNVAVYVEIPRAVASRIGGMKRQADGWVQLPYSYTDGVDIYFNYVFFGPGEVLIGFCEGLEYRVVVVE